jgi:hypothetical protein
MYLCLTIICVPHYDTYILVECKARFTSATVAADQEVELEVYLRVRCPFPVRFSKVSISLNNPVSTNLCILTHVLVKDCKKGSLN